MNIEDILDLSLEERKLWMSKSKQAYYETDTPLLSDDDYDTLEDSIIADEPSAKYVGVNSRHNKSEHSNPMLSLDKFKINKDQTNTKEILTNIYNGYGNETLTLSFKEDGLAMNVEFEDGKLKQIVTRGNRLKGVNRTAKLRHIIDGNEDWEQFFDYHKKGEVRCECVMSYDIFEKHYSESGKKHPRNMASGLVSDENIERGIDHLDLIVLEGLDADGDFIDVSILPSYKECVEDITTFEEFEEAFNKLKAMRLTYKNPTDGLVVAQQILHTKFEHDGHYPEHAIAIKFTPPKFETVVTDIVWNLKKTGNYIPNVRFEAVEVDGRDIGKASGHNLNWLVDKGVKIGSKILIELSGDIIPYISGTVKAE